MATAERVQPEPVPDVIVLTLTEDEAQSLRNVLGASYPEDNAAAGVQTIWLALDGVTSYEGRCQYAIRKIEPAY